MGANVEDTFCRRDQHDTDSDSSDDEDDPYDIFERNKADKALENDIDKKVQFWIDCIQCSVPGAAIMVVATHDDYFDDDPSEGQRRCRTLKGRILDHEQKKKKRLEERLEYLEKTNSAETHIACRIRNLLSVRPKIIFGKDDDNSGVVRVSGKDYKGFDRLAEKIINISTGRDVGGKGRKYPIFRGHVGTSFHDR